MPLKRGGGWRWRWRWGGEKGLRYLDVAVPDFITGSGRTGGFIPGEVAVVFDCAEDGVLLFELSFRWGGKVREVSPPCELAS